MFRAINQDDMTTPRLRRHAVALMLSMAVSSLLTAGENWTSFQNGGHIVLTGEAASAAWAPSWSAEIPGTGQSSPVVWGNRVYVTSVTGPQKETYHVAAYDLNRGDKLWQYDLANASPQESTNYVSLAAPTPVVDEHGIVAFFEGGNLVALTHTGEVRWERNLVDEYGAIDARHGLGSSVAQTAEAAIVWVERQSEPYVLAVEKNSGDTLWKVAGLGTTSWSSPRILDVAGGPHLVLSGVGTIVGLDLATGERLWTLDDISGNSTPTPMPYAKGRFLIGATVGREGGDSSSSAESNGAVAVEQSESGEWQARFIWRARRATSSFGSPIAHQGLAYFVNRAGVLYGLDLETGEETFAERIGGSIWATPIARGNQVYLPRKDGTVSVLAAGPDFKVVTEFSVADKQAASASSDDGPSGGGPTLYAAVIVGDRLLARLGDRLACFQPE